MRGRLPMPAVVVLLVRSIGVTWLCVVAPELAPLPAAPLPAPGVVERLSTGTSVSSLVLEQPASASAATMAPRWYRNGLACFMVLSPANRCGSVFNVWRSLRGDRRRAKSAPERAPHRLPHVG